MDDKSTVDPSKHEGRKDVAFRNTFSIVDLFKRIKRRKKIQACLHPYCGLNKG